MNNERGPSLTAFNNQHHPNFMGSVDTQRGGPPHSAFILSNPPLAALHNMTEMKAPSTGNPHHQNTTQMTSQGNPFAQNGYNPLKTLTAAAVSAATSAGTPHGISDILSRAGSLEQLQCQLSAASNMQTYLNTSTRFPKPIAELPGRAPIFWPGASVLHSNASIRTHGDYAGQQSPGLHDKDKNKKHTRPTFSGHQIFALEKTFEQTKYLAGPERARLAYALGMTESQVKVWFQNRRTKWRKKHAAEMATAKRKQEEQADQMDSDMEDAENLHDFNATNNNTFKHDFDSFSLS